MSPAVRALLASLALSSAVAVLPSGGCLEPSAATEAEGGPDPSVAVAPFVPPSAPPARTPPIATPGDARANNTPHDAPTGSADPLLRRLAQKPLRYTRHGRCRMTCRHISEAEVRALDEGHVVPERTRSDGQCTSYAVEGQTADAQDVRIVYADCARETRVVTTIDLGRDWPCHCD